MSSAFFFFEGFLSVRVMLPERDAASADAAKGIAIMAARIKMIVFILVLFILMHFSRG